MPERVDYARDLPDLCSNQCRAFLGDTEDVTQESLLFRSRSATESHHGADIERPAQKDLLKRDVEQLHRTSVARVFYLVPRMNRSSGRARRQTGDSSGRAEPHVLDRIDRQLLKRLQEDGRVPLSQLASEVNLTVTPCHERVRRLEAIQATDAGL